MLAGLPRKELLFGFNAKTTVAGDIYIYFFKDGQKPIPICDGFLKGGINPLWK